MIYWIRISQGFPYNINDFFLKKSLIPKNRNYGVFS